MDWLKLIVMVVFGVLLIIGVVALFAFALFWILLALVVLSIAWALGVPLVIKQSGKPVGYVRWFKFHKV